MCVFYFPASLNLKRYRLYAWLAIFPARFLGAVFFILAVFVVGYPQGYLFDRLCRSWYSFPPTPDPIERSARRTRRGAVSQVHEHERNRCDGRRHVGESCVVQLISRAAPAVGGRVDRRILQIRLNRGRESKRAALLDLARSAAHVSRSSAGSGRLCVVWPAMGAGTGNAHRIHQENHRIRPGRVQLRFLPHRRGPAFGDDPVPIIYTGGPSHTFNALAYQRFLFKAANDPRFTTKNIMNAIDEVTQLSILDNALYRFVLIPFTRKALLKQKEAFAWTDGRPDWGPGRIDPFNPVKVAILQKVNPKVGVGDTIGNADMVAIWNLRARGGMAYHWDGLNTDVTEVVLSSAIGDGATPKSIPLGNLHRLQNWLMNLKPAPFPFLDKLDASLASPWRGHL